MHDPSLRRWWPATPHDFVNVEKCPACFTAVTQAVCTNCQLNLADPQAARLLEIGKSIVSAENSRQEVISRIRQATQAAAAPVVAPTASAPVATPVAESGEGMPQSAAPADVVTAPPVPAASAPAPVAPAPAPAATIPAPVGNVARPAAPQGMAPPPPAQPAPKQRRLSVPVLLLIVGVSLASVAAIGLAWYYSNIVVRALIIAAFTVATIVVAGMLRKRKLTMTAEGVAVLGVVLLALDGWAVYANNLFGAGQVRPVIYAGAAILVTGVLSRVWAVLSQLRAPDFAAVLALPSGIGLIVAGVLRFDETGALATVLLGAALGALVYALPAPFSVARPKSVVERTTLASIGVGTLAAGALSAAFALPDAPLAPLWFMAIVLVLAAGHLLALRGNDGVTAAPLLRGFALVTGTVAIATLGWQLAARLDDHIITSFLAPVLAIAVFSLLARQHPRLAPLTTAPFIAATVVAALSLVIMLTRWLSLAAAENRFWFLWDTAPFAASDTWVFWVLGAAMTIAALLFIVPDALLSAVRMLRPIVVAPVLLIGAFATGMPGAVVVASALIGVGAVLVNRREAATSDAVTASAASKAWVVVSALAAAVSFFAGMMHPALWLVALVLTAALPLALAWAMRAAGLGLSLCAVAPVAVLAFASVWGPGALEEVLRVEGGGALTTLLLLQWLAIVVLGIALVVTRSVRFALTIAGLGTAALGVLPLISVLLGVWVTSEPTVRDVIDTPWLSAVRAGLTAAMLLWLTLRRETAKGLRAGAAALLAPALGTLGALVLGLAVLGFRAPTSLFTGAVWEFLREVHVGILLAVIAAVIAIVGAVLSFRTPHAARTAADISAIVIAVLAVFTTFIPQQWISIVAVAVLLAAASVAPGWRNLVVAPVAASVAPNPAPRTRNSLRRLIAWGAFAAGTWAWLVGIYHHVLSPSAELLVLPIAIGLALFCAALVWLRRYVEASLAVVLALTVGLVLLTIKYLTEPTPLTIITAISAALVLALHWTPARRIWGVATAGATTALVAGGFAVSALITVGQPVHIVWALVLVVVAYLAGIGAAWRANGRPLFAQFAPPLALAGATVSVSMSLYFLSLSNTAHNLVLAGTLLGLGAVHLASSFLARTPLGTVSRITSGVLLALVGLTNIAPTGFDMWPQAVAAAILLAGVVCSLLRTRGAPTQNAEFVPWIGGLVLAGLAAFDFAGGLLVPTIFTAIVATAIAAVGALAMRQDRWYAFGGWVALFSAATALMSIAHRYMIAIDIEMLAVEAVIWPLVATISLAAIAAVALLVAPRPATRTVSMITLSLATVVLALGELGAMTQQSTFDAQLMSVLTVTLLTAIAVSAYFSREFLGTTLLGTAAASAVLFASISITALAVRPVELLTVPLAAGLIAIGLRILAINPQSRTWPTLGPGLALLTLPSLLHDFGPTALWRVVALGVVAVALIVWGAMRRLQAPLVIGSAVALVHALAQLWPWIRAAYEAAEWWMWAGVAGILLIVLAIRYEKQKVAMRKAFVAVTALR